MYRSVISTWHIAKKEIKKKKENGREVATHHLPLVGHHPKESMGGGGGVCWWVESPSLHNGWSRWWGDPNPLLCWWVGWSTHPWRAWDVTYPCSLSWWGHGWVSFLFFIIIFFLFLVFYFCSLFSFCHALSWSGTSIHVDLFYWVWCCLIPTCYN